jgi:heme-degrading monooxygenase HmoA
LSWQYHFFVENIKTMNKQFVAVNYITCQQDYQERFEQLFSSRAHAIDTLPGFRDMHVLKPQQADDNYLVVSYWDSEAHFTAWTKSAAFLEGHKRAFANLAQYKAEGKEVPMKSSFKTYQILCN